MIDKYGKVSIDNINPQEKIFEFDQGDSSGEQMKFRMRL